MADMFCGWYFRCQSETDTVALIPAVHTAGGKRSGSLQIISDAGAWMLPFPGEQAHVDRMKSYAVLGFCLCVRFSLAALSRGCSLVVVHRLLHAVASPVAEHTL